LFSEDPHANTRAEQLSESDKKAEFYKEWERLRGVATSTLSYDRPGSFLTSFLDAFCRADWSNAELLLPVMQQLEKKYKLEDRFPELQKHRTLDRSSGEPGLT
jgi:hypothetical protein